MTRKGKGEKWLYVRVIDLIRASIQGQDPLVFEVSLSFIYLLIHFSSYPPLYPYFYSPTIAFFFFFTVITRPFPRRFSGSLNGSRSPNTRLYDLLFYGDPLQWYFFRRLNGTGFLVFKLKKKW